ncbi:MAG TPA: glycosyltransferase family 4 protein [Thermoleophilia bacterium]|nr:glycosyltransferase family 4 protein [Thermoleophilia bacterium]
MPIVCMFVYNNMLHDARVRKEARTLTEAGYQVTVVAIHEPGRTLREERVDGFRIVRQSRSILGVSRREIMALVRRRPATLVTPKARPQGQAAAPSRRSGIAGRVISHLESVIRLAVYPLRRVLVFERFVRAGLRTRADIYHAHDLNTLFMAWTASRLRRTPLIYDTHEVATDRADMKLRWWAALLESVLIRRTDRAICTTATRAEFTRKRYNIPMPTVLRNLPAYVEPEPSGLVHERLRLSPLEKIVLYQGGIQPQRGLEQLLVAARDIRGGVVVFLGSGRLKPQLVEEVKKLGLTDVVRFHDAVPVAELPAWTACAYVGLQILQNTCFNHYSSLSNKLLEYMMAGIPVIANDLPEMRRVIEDTGAGFVVDASDPKAIASAVNEILADPARRDQMSEAAKAARRRYSWETEEHILTKLYAQLLPARQCPPTA